MDEVFRALADPGRRALLDALNARNGQTLRELCAVLAMTRQSVSKHLGVLEAAELITTTRRGREKLHHLNAAPITAIADRWISRYDQPRAMALAALKTSLEERAMNEFVYTTHIATTAETLWRAITEPEFTRRYWGAELVSDWRPGSPVLWREGDGPAKDLGQVVLEAEPPTLLSYTWHNYQPEHATFFGWSEQQLAQLREEPISQVRFTIEGDGPVRLTVRHSGFAGDTLMRRAVAGALPPSGGWPEILSGLKTLLETGSPLGS